MSTFLFPSLSLWLPISRRFIVRADGLDDDGRQLRPHDHHLTSSDDMLNEHFYDVPEGEDYLAIYETIDRKRQEAKEFKVQYKVFHWTCT